MITATFSLVQQLINLKSLPAYVVNHSGGSKSHILSLSLVFGYAIPQRHSKARSTFLPPTGPVSIDRVSASTDGSARAHSLHRDVVLLLIFTDLTSLSYAYGCEFLVISPVFFPKSVLDSQLPRSCSPPPL